MWGEFSVSRRDLFRASGFLVPTALLAFLATFPIPYPRHAAREVAGYFQSLAILRDGLASYTYITPVESLSALHLHSVLSAPFVALLGPRGGRYLSIVAALVAMWVVYRAATYFTNRSVGVMAAAGLAVQPLFLHHAHAFKPEALSVALTSAAVFATLLAVREPDESRRFYVSVALAALAIPIHLWEAVVLLPVVSIYLIHGEYARGLIAGAVGLMVAALTYLGTTLQSVNAQDLQGWVSSGEGLELLLDPSFYLTGGTATSVTVLTGIAVIPLSGVLFYLTRSERWLVTGSWALSGFSVLAIVPGHFSPHYYTAWGFIAPVAVFGALFTHHLVSNLDDALPVSRSTAFSLVTMLLLVGSTGYLVVDEVPEMRQPAPETYSEYADAGTRASELLGGSDRLAIEADGLSNPYYDEQFSIAVINSGILPMGHLQATNDTWPRIVDRDDGQSGCDVMIRLSSGTVVATQCE